MTEFVEHPNESIPDFENAHCNKCLQTTRHKVRGHRKTYFNYSTHEYPAWGDLTYQMLECCGCNDIIFRKRVHLEDWDVDDDESGTYREGEDVTYYPPAVSRPEPAWLKQLEESIQSLTGEVYSALYSDSKALAAMGARAVLDMAIVDTVGDCGRFDEKLQALQDNGLISKEGRTILEAALDAGSAAAHRGYAPSSKDLNLVMDIVEHILEAIYILPKAASDLKQRTPQRKPRK